MLFCLFFFCIILRLRSLYQALRRALLQHEGTIHPTAQPELTRPITTPVPVLTTVSRRQSMPLMPRKTSDNSAPEAEAGAQEALAAVSLQSEVIVKGDSDIITFEQLQIILSKVPKRFQLREWQLRFT